MRSGILFFLLALLLSCQVGAQSPYIDSLRNALERSTGKQRVDALNAYGYVLLSYDYHKAQNLIQEAQKLSTQLGYKKGIAESLLNEGIIDLSIGKDTIALNNFRKGIKVLSGESAPHLKGRILSNIGQAYRLVNQLDSASIYYQRSYQFLKDSLNPLYLSYLYLTLSDMYQQQNNQELELRYLLKSWEIRKRLPIKYPLVWVASGLSNFFVARGEYDKAMAYLNEAKAALKNDTIDNEGICNIYKNQGIIEANKGNHLRALDLFAKAKKFYERNPFPWDLANLLTEVGYVQSDLSNYETSLKYYFQAIRLAENNHYESIQALLYFRIAWVYYSMNQNLLAEEYCNKTLQIASPHHYQFEEASALNLLGLLAMRNNRDEKALQYFNNSLNLRKKNNNPIRISSTLLNIGLLYEKLRDYKRAETYQLQSLAMEEKANHLYGICNSHLSLGILYLHMKEYTKAERHLSTAEDLAVKTGLREVLAEIYKNKRDLWLAQSDYRHSLLYSMRYEEIKDSLLNRNMSNRILTLRHDFELDQKESEIKILNQQRALQQSTLDLQKSEITRQRTIIIVGVIVSLAVGAFAIIVFWYYRKVKQLNSEISERSEEIAIQADELRKANEGLGNLNREISEQKEEIQAQAEELTESNQTIARINEGLEDKIKLRTSELKEAYHELDTFLYRSSHDFRRPLTTFMGLAEVAKVSVKESAALELFEKVKETANNLDKMLGKLQSVNLISTAGLMQSEIDFKSLFESEQHLFQHEFLRKKIIVTTEVKIAKPILSYPILLKVVIQNLIENAIAFCGEEKPMIHLSATSADGEVLLQVSDNGQGIDAAYLPRVFEMYFRANERSIGNGLGLYIVRKMVDKLCGRVEIQSEIGKGTDVKIFLPLFTNA